MIKNNIALYFALVAKLAERQHQWGIARGAHKAQRSAEEVAWLMGRAQAKRMRRQDRNRWNAEMQLCSGRDRLLTLPYRVALAGGYIKPKRRHGHAAH